MESEIELKKKNLLWKTAIALQAVDGLKTSDELAAVATQNAEGEISVKEAIAKAEKIDDPYHANLVAARMFAVLSKKEFSFTIDYIVKIHKTLFEGLLENAGDLRKKNIAKKEWALDGDVLLYPAASSVPDLLEKIFLKESEFTFEGLDSNFVVKHIADFISELWQIHPFEKFNTRTLGVFFVKYLEHFGFSTENETLVKNPVYFRNSLVRAAFSAEEKNIQASTNYFAAFIENLLFNQKNELNHKAVHINFNPNGVALKEFPQPQQPQPQQPQVQNADALQKSSEVEKNEKPSLMKKIEAMSKAAVEKPPVKEKKVSEKKKKAAKKETAPKEKKATAKKTIEKKSESAAKKIATKKEIPAENKTENETVKKEELVQETTSTPVPVKNKKTSSKKVVAKKEPVKKEVTPKKEKAVKKEPTEKKALPKKEKVSKKPAEKKSETAAKKIATKPEAIEETETKIKNTTRSASSPSASAANKKTNYVSEDPQVAKICKKAKIECNEKIDKILEYLIANKSITNSHARELTASSTETVRKILVGLSEKGVVTMQGINKHRVYSLNETSKK